GMTYITRRRSYLTACFNAKARDANVLPPPVGTLSENICGGRSARLVHVSRIALRLRLMKVGSTAANRVVRYDSSRLYSSRMEGFDSAAIWADMGLQKLRVSIVSASTRHE